jgi:hypothetical protein
MRAYLEHAEKQASGWVVAERVARIREGFDWVMKETGFTAADLDLGNRSDASPSICKPHSYEYLSE